MEMVHGDLSRRISYRGQFSYCSFLISLGSMSVRGAYGGTMP